MGWSLLDSNTYNILSRHDRSMIVFSHSSFWDLVIFILYGLAYPDRDHHLRTLMTPWPFRWMDRFHVRSYFQSFIESTRVEDKNGGTLNRIVSQLDTCPKFVFLISPKGTLRNTPWRTGYYHIARQLHLPIIAAGLDYETQSVVVHPPIWADDDELIVQQQLKSKLGTIVPLYPEGEGMTIRPHKHRRIIRWPIV